MEILKQKSFHKSPANVFKIMYVNAGAGDSKYGSVSRSYVAYAFTLCIAPCFNDQNGYFCLASIFCSILSLLFA
jgi:hypothetical protein